MFLINSFQQSGTCQVIFVLSNVFHHLFTTSNPITSEQVNINIACINPLLTDKLGNYHFPDYLHRLLKIHFGPSPLQWWMNPLAFTNTHVKTLIQFSFRLARFLFFSPYHILSCSVLIPQHTFIKKTHLCIHFSHPMFTSILSVSHHIL